MCSRARTEAELARLVARRIVAAEGESGPRLAHVRGVVETVRATAAAGAWPPATMDGAIRAAWLHDVLRLEEPARLRRRIEEAGEEPDPWAVAHAPRLLHAQGAALWAAARGETDPEVLSAVRHHPTGHPEWGPVGLLLYVADFCEPGRPYAGRLGTSRIRTLATQGEEGLEEAARRVLGIRMAHQLAKGGEMHPHSLDAWRRWFREAP
jgi:HD superfamily phosphohydrolase YqeK